jgi:hypothetical protein
MCYLKQFLIAVLLSLSFGMFSQSECQEDIDKANKLFDDGMYREAAKVSKKILETCSLNNTQENEMLKLIASIYYEMDELELAQEYMDQFIKKNPHYISSKRTDPVQFRNAVSKIKSFPIFSVGIKAGIPLGQVSTIKVFPILDNANYMNAYSVRPVFEGGLELSWNMASFVSLNIGSGLRMQELRHMVTQYDQLFFHYKEQNISSTFPFSLGFSAPIGKTFALQAYFGGELELFVQSKYGYDYTGIDNISKTLAVYLSQKPRTNVSVKPAERAKYRYAALGGLRLSYKVERFSIFADARYIHELVLYNNPQKRFSDPDLYLSHNYVLADVMLENLDISMGIMYNFSYKVKSKY